MARLIKKLEDSPPFIIIITDDMRADIYWWVRFLPDFNGTQPMWLELSDPDTVFATDATLV